MRNNPTDTGNENHKGIDIGVPLNTKVVAVKSGHITDSGFSDSYGYYVKYQTFDKYDILYAHLNSVVVKKGDSIIQGDTIAYSGNTGNSTGPHLHYEIKFNDKYINPEECIKID